MNRAKRLFAGPSADRRNVFEEYQTALKLAADSRRGKEVFRRACGSCHRVDGVGPATPVINLPPQFASSPGVSVETISRYDDRGPAWYWNTIRLGEHTGTHFDAPVHWITGRDLPDNACDTIPACRFVGPACVIDVTRAVADVDIACQPAGDAGHGKQREATEIDPT